MLINAIETFIVDGGWRPWCFVAVRTDEGLTGYGECSEGHLPHSVASTVNELGATIIGRDAGAIEARYWDLYRLARSSAGGIAAKAIAGIELALWDLKGKALGVPVHTLLGGPIRTHQQVYWSHCGPTRIEAADVVGEAPIRDWADVAALGREVVEHGFTALKTNVFFPGDPGSILLDGFGGGPGSTDGNADAAMIAHIRTLVGTFRNAAGPDVGIALDLNYNFAPEAVRRICAELEDLKPMWVEVDVDEPKALAGIREATAIPICSGENLFETVGYLPFLEERAMDIAMVDVAWNGFGVSKRIADLARTFNVNVAPHNYASHLGTLQSLHLCAVVPNVRICEIDVDDVPWKDDLVDAPVVIENGSVAIPDRPGWGADLIEEVAAAHPWGRERSPGYWTSGGST